MSRSGMKPWTSTCHVGFYQSVSAAMPQPRDKLFGSPLMACDRI